jgi:hypothetical protein
MRHALAERQTLIEQRAATLLDTAITAGEPWTARLGPKPDEPRKQAAWLTAARTIAAYRDRYQITDDQHPLGPEPENVSQKIDAARAHAALAQARRITDEQQTGVEQRPAVAQRDGLGL